MDEKTATATVAAGSALYVFSGTDLAIGAIVLISLGLAFGWVMNTKFINYKAKREEEGTVTNNRKHDDYNMPINK